MYPDELRLAVANMINTYYCTCTMHEIQHDQRQSEILYSENMINRATCAIVFEFARNLTFSCTIFDHSIFRSFNRLLNRKVNTLPYGQAMWNAICTTIASITVAILKEKKMLS